MSLLELLKSDNTICANRSIARLIGLNETIMLGELIYKADYFFEKGELFEIEGLGKGFFYTTHEELEYKTLQGRTAQRRSINALKKLNFLTTFFNSKEARVYFRVEQKAIENFLKSNNLSPVSPKKKQIKQKFIPVQSEQGGCSIRTPNDINNDITSSLKNDTLIPKQSISSPPPLPPLKPKSHVLPKRISLSSQSEKNIVELDVAELVLEDGRPASRSLKLYLQKMQSTNPNRVRRNYALYREWIQQGKGVKKGHEQLLQWMLATDLAGKEANTIRNRDYMRAVVATQGLCNVKITKRSVNFYKNGNNIDSIELNLPRESFNAAVDSALNSQKL